MADTPTLVVALEAQLNKFEKQLQDAGVIAQKQTKTIEDNFNKMNPSFEGLKSGLLALGGYLSVDKLVSGLKDILENLSNIQHLSDRAGVSTDFIQALGHAVELAGGSMDDTAHAMERLNKELGSNNPNSFTLQLLKLNGVQTQVNGKTKDSEELFGDLAKLITNIQDPQKAMNVLWQVFGFQVGPKMLTVLQDVAEKGVPAFVQAAKDAGLVIDEKLIKKGDDLDSAWDTLLTKMGNKWKSFIVQTANEWDILIQAMSGAADVQPKDSPFLELQKQADELKFDIAEIQKQLANDPFNNLLQTALSNSQNQLNGILAQIKAIQDAAAANRPSVVITKESSQATKIPAPPVPQTDFDRAIEAAEKRIAEGNAEVATINDTAEAQARAKVEADLMTAALEANTKAGMQNNDVTDAQLAKINAVGDAMEEMAKKTADANLPLNQFAREATKTTENLQNVVVDGLNSFNDAIIAIGEGTKSTAQAFKDMAKSILEDLAKLILRAEEARLLSALGITSSGGGGSLFPIPGATPTPVNGVTPTAGLQTPVSSLRSSMRVPANIVSRSAGGGVTVAPVYNIDARGSTVSRDEIKKMIDDSAEKTRQDVVPIVRQAQSRRVL